MKNNFKKSNQYLNRSLKTIPLASQTFSKSLTQYPSGVTPYFFSKARGSKVWDIDGNRYIDFVNSLLSISIGYRNKDIDDAVLKQMKNGVIFSMPHKLETELAELICKIIPCAESVRFSKNGSDATAGAIRLSRAYTNREHIAVCGYHGWQDWYIGSTARHLGVPESVRALTFSFPYNDLDALERLISEKKDKFAAIVMEPIALSQPSDGFLQSVRDIATEHGIILVFDEIISGFRMNIGGAQAELGVTPDLAVFGKAMGNGMPISAITGPASLMAYFEDIFVSGTFGGEALSLAAAIATVDKLEADDIPRKLRIFGAKLSAKITAVIADADLSENYLPVGSDWWPGFVPNPRSNVDPNLLTSLLRQELIANNILMGNTFNLCSPHMDSGIFDQTVVAFERATRSVSAALKLPNPWCALRGEPIQPVFTVRN